MLLARLLGRLGADGRAQSAALAVAAIKIHPEGQPLRTHELAEAVRIAHGGGVDLELCRRGDDEVWTLRAADEPPEEWLGAAVARLDAAAADEPAEMARFVVERVVALQHLRLLVTRSLFGASEPDPDTDVGIALHWRPDLAAIETGLGRELAQGVFFAADGARERERIVHLHALERERGDWIRWAGEKDRLGDLAEGFGGGLSAGIAARLEPLLALSRSGDDEQIRASDRATRWHEAERR